MTAVGETVIMQAAALQALELAGDEVKLACRWIASDPLLSDQCGIESLSAESRKQVLDALVHEAPFVPRVMTDDIVARPDGEPAAENHAERKLLERVEGFAEFEQIASERGCIADQSP